MHLSLQIALGMIGTAYSQESSTPEDRAEQADVAFELGVLHMRRAEYLEGLSFLLHSNSLAPNRNVLFNIAGAYEALGRYEQAYQYYTDYLELEKDPWLRRQGEEGVARLASKVALIRVDSDPPGATIYLDRVELGARGVTPRTIAVPQGRHQVILQARGYIGADYGVDAIRGSVSSASTPLIRMLGPVNVIGEPAGAEIRLDGEDRVIGVVPSEISVPVGSSILDIRAPGYADRKVLVEVDEEEVAQVDGSLQPITGQLIVDTVGGKGALIEIDGQAMAFTPAVVDVPVGRHTLRVSSSGYGDFVQEIDITEQTPVTFDLRLRSIGDLLTFRADVGSFLGLDVAHTPISVTIIDQGQIRASGARHLAELLEIYVPGFQYMFNKWNGQIWGLRGIAPDRNTKIIFLVNGLAQNTQSRDGVYTETSLGLLDDIERVEVLRGPSGLTYGSGAIAGVVNVVTRNPEETSGDIAGTYGSAHGYAGEALASLAPNEDTRLTASAGYRFSQGLGDRETRIFGANSWPSDGAPQENGVPGDGSAWSTPGNFRALADYSFRNIRVWGRYTHQAEPTGAMFEVDPWPSVIGGPPEGLVGTVDGAPVSPEVFGGTESYGENRRVQIVDNVVVDVSGYAHQGPDRIDVEAAFMGVSNTTASEWRDGYGAGSGPAPGAVSETFGEKRYQIGLKYAVKRVEALQAVFGVQYRADHLGPDLLGRNMHGGVPTHPSISDVWYHNVALFTEDAYSLETFTLSAGTRFDLHTRTDGILSPKVAAIWTPSAQNSIKLFYQSAVNNGSADTYEFNWRHFDDEGEVQTRAHFERPTGGARIPATTEEDLHALLPERAHSIELSSVHQLAEGRLTLSPSASYNRITDLQAWNQALFRVYNAGRYDFVSLEAAASYDTELLDANLSHTFQRPISADLEPTEFRLPRTEQIDNGDGTLGLVVVPGEFDTVQVASLRDGITADGKTFLNLTTHVSKLTLDLHPIPFLDLHQDLRVFWGLPGRSDLIAPDVQAGENYLGVDKRPMVKWNVGAMVNLPGKLQVDFHVFDILGQEDSLHAVRWQQMAEPAQREVYTLDQRSFLIRIRQEY